MKRFYRLLNYDFNIIFRFMCGISLILIIGQNLLLSSYVSNNSRLAYIPFDKLVDMSGVPFVFYFCMVMSAACCVYSVVVNFMGSKSIYTLMSLPGMRKKVYFSKLTAGAAALLMLFAAQLISIFIGYMLFSTSIITYENGIVTSERPVNGLFLAFTRSEFLRVLFPISPESFISTAAIIISVLCGIYFVMDCIQSGKYVNILITFINIVTVIYIINYRVNELRGLKHHNLYIFSIFFIAVSVYYIWQSITWIEQGKNLG